MHKVFSYTHRKVLVFRCTENNTFFLFRKSQKHLFPNNGKRYCFRCNKKHELSGVTTVNRVFSGLPDHYSNTSLILFLYHLQVLTPSSWVLLQKFWLAFQYVLKDSSSVTYPFCVLTCTFLLVANKVQLFHGLGLYSGIFALYLHCPSDKTRKSNVVFYILSLLYVFCAATFISDLITVIFGVSNNSIWRKILSLSSFMQSIIGGLSPQLQIILESRLIRISIVQTTINACCDFISQCIIVRISHSSYIYYSFYSPKSSKIYRCWMVWGGDIRIVIIPSFLAFTVLGQSIYLRLISQF